MICIFNPIYNSRKLTNLPKVRQLFTPIQPTVRQKGDLVIYQEVLPDYTLLNYIYCYWILKTQSALEEAFSYRVVADGCIDIFFEIQNAKNSFVMGFCKKYTEFHLGNSFHYAGVRFLPTIFPQLYGVDAAELSNKSQVLDAVVPDLANYLDSKVHNDLDNEDLKTVFDQYFITQLGRLKWQEDHRFYEALNIILKTNGVLQVEKDLNTGLSSRQLRRKFQYYIGTSPKSFGK